MHVVGRLEVLHDGVAVELPASKKTRALLGYLVVTGRAHTRERLCDLLWDVPDDPRAALRWSLWKLRPLVDHGRTQRLVATRDRAGFEAHGAEVDLARVRQALAGGIAATKTQALEEAASLLRGELLEGLELDDCFRWHEWYVAERESLRSTHAAVLDALVERLADRPEDALRHARARLAVDPLAEQAHVAVMHLLERLGRVREAIDQYEACRRVLERELHVRPSAKLEDARRRLRVPAPSPAASAASRAPSEAPRPLLVGRAVELAAIDEALAAASEGRSPGLLALVGDAGIGKSRLLDELCARAAEGGALVLRGRAYEAERRRPYGPLIDALGAATGDLPAAADRAALWSAITERVARLARERPVALVIDDLHWLDEDSAALVHHAVRTLAGARLLVATAARAGELGDNIPCVRVLRALARDSRLVRLAVGPLDAAAAEALVRSVAGDANAERIARESEGNPLFALELARASGDADRGIPPSLEDAIEERLERLDDASRQVVPWLAAFGRGMPAQVLADVTELPATQIASMLEQLERRGVVRAGAEAWDFSHDLVRRVAYDRTSSPRRAIVHLQIARVLARLDGDDGAWAGEVARHAALGGDAELCARACVRAGERCLRLFAYGAAESLSELGRRNAAKLAREVRIPLQVGLFALAVHPALKLRTRGALAGEVARVAAEAAEAGFDVERSRALVLLARLHYHAWDDVPRARAALAQAVAVLEKNPAANVEALVSGVRCLALVHADMPRVRELFAALGELGEGVVDSLYFQWGVGLVRRWEGDAPAARTALRRAVEHARRRGDHWAEFECATALAMLELEAGDGEAARRAAHDGLAASERLGPAGSERAFAAALDVLARGDDAALARAIGELDRLDASAHAAYARSAASARALARGDATAARALAERALECAVRAAQPVEVARAHAALGMVARAEGRHTDAAAAWAESKKLGADLPAQLRGIVGGAVA